MVCSFARGFGHFTAAESRRARNLHALLLDHGGSARAGEECDQFSRRVRGLRASADARHECDVRLNVGWQRADQLDAGRGQNLRDHGQPDFDVAFGHELRDDVGVGPYGFGCERTSDVQALEQAREVDAAAHLQIGDRPGVEQGAREGVDGADVGLPASQSHLDADSRSSNLGSRARDDSAFADPLVHRNRPADENVEWFAVVESALKCRRQVRRDQQSMSGGALELAANLREHRGQGAGGPDMDFCGGRGAGGRCDDRQHKDANRASHGLMIGCRAEDLE